MLKDVLKNLKQHCMSGISYMIPVIVIGGFCTALARLAGNVDTAGTIGYAFLQELLTLSVVNQELHQV